MSMLNTAGVPRSLREAGMKCSNCPARDSAVCADCDSDELRALEKIRSFQKFAPAQEIIAAQEPIRFVGNIVSGVVKLTRLMADGRRQIIGLRFKGDLIGRSASELADHDANAVTEVMLCKFRRKEFHSLLERYPNVMQRNLDMTLSELDDAHEWLVVLGQKTAREKVATFLCLLADRIGENHGRNARSFDIPITRDEVADYLGLTIETVSRQISRMKASGLIRLEGTRHVHVPDLAALLDASAGDAEGGVFP